MSEVEKLRVLIPHWIEHNKEHAAEFRKWAEQAGEATPEILSASDEMDGAERRVSSPRQQHQGRRVRKMAGISSP